MPQKAIKDIVITLRSQHGISSIPEFLPSDASLPLPPLPSASEANTTCIYCLAHPSSQFWINYRIFPNASPSESGIPAGEFQAASHANEESDLVVAELAPYYYFKLYFPQSATPTVSWGVGAEDGYTGSTSFSLFDAGPRWEEKGKGTLEKRVFCFPKAEEKYGKLDVKKHWFEIKVFRAKGRKRIPREVETFVDKKKGKAGAAELELVNGGPAKGVPKRFYKFALIDPLDQPYAVFRYYYRTEEQLKALGFKIPRPELEITERMSPVKRQIVQKPVESESHPSLESESTIADISSSDEDDAEEEQALKETETSAKGILSSANNRQPTGSPDPTSSITSVSSSSSTDTASGSDSNYLVLPNHSSVSTVLDSSIRAATKHIKRLSIPPLHRLLPTSGSPLPFRSGSPTKTATNPHITLSLSSTTRPLLPLPSPTKDRARTSPPPFLSARPTKTSPLPPYPLLTSLLPPLASSSPRNPRTPTNSLDLPQIHLTVPRSPSDRGRASLERARYSLESPGPGRNEYHEWLARERGSSPDLSERGSEKGRLRGRSGTPSPVKSDGEGSGKDEAKKAKGGKVRGFGNVVAGVWALRRKTGRSGSRSPEK